MLTSWLTSYACLHHGLHHMLAYVMAYIIKNVFDNFSSQIYLVYMTKICEIMCSMHSSTTSIFIVKNNLKYDRNIRFYIVKKYVWNAASKIRFICIYMYVQYTTYISFHVFYLNSTFVEVILN